MSYIGKAPGFGIRNRYYYTATASQTTFSGADDNGQTLAYADSKYLDVYLNGVLLVAGTDYTATTLTSVTLTSGASASDIIEIVAYDIFSVADTVSSASGGTFNGAVTFDAGLNTDTISEETSGSGVTIDGVLLKDGEVTVTDKIIHAGDTNTALRFPAADTVTVETGGSERVRIDSSGRITTPAQPALTAIVSSNKVVGTTTSLQFDSITLNRGSAITASLSNSRFTVPVTGYYWISFSWFLGSASLDYAMTIKKNGADQFRIGANITGVTGTPDNPGSGSAIVISLQANDYIELFGSGTKTILGTTPAHTVLSMTLIG